jgi:hypothetical protein
MTITAGTAHKSNTGMIVSLTLTLTLIALSRLTGLPKFLLLGADLRGLDRRLRLDLGLVDAISHNGRGCGGRLAVDDGALLRGRVADDVELGGAGGLRAEGERGESAVHDHLLHGVFL